MKNVQLIEEAYRRLSRVVKKTTLDKNDRLSERYGADVYLKREDLQIVRSYKLRGAYNFLATLKPAESVCASAGNHAQGVAFAAKKLGLKARIYMPETTPMQKINRVKNFGGKNVEIVLWGNTYDEAAKEAKNFAKKNSKCFVHPFDDELVSAGQGTVALEILSQLEESPDIVVIPVGGGGLLSGVVNYLSKMAPECKVYAVEPKGAESLANSLAKGKNVALEKVSTFVDGASVKKVGDIGFRTARKYKVKCLSVSEEKICNEMVEMYQSEGMVVEPAGALAVSALGDIPQKELKGKKVVCLISGGNNDISRYPEIVEKSLIYQGLKHYFLVNFSQKPGALKNFVNNILGPSDDITLFEYLKKNNREKGPVLVGIQLSKKSDLNPLTKRLIKFDPEFKKLDSDSVLYKFLL